MVFHTSKTRLHIAKSKFSPLLKILIFCQMEKRECTELHTHHDFSVTYCIVVLSDFGNIIWIHRRMKNYLLNCWRNLHNFFFQRLPDISGCTQIKHYVGGDLCSSCWLAFFNKRK